MIILGLYLFFNLSSPKDTFCEEILLSLAEEQRKPLGLDGLQKAFL